MSDDDAWRWLSVGIILVLIGVTLLRFEEAILLTMWGVGLSLSGGAIALVGTGVLLRLWR